MLGPAPHFPRHPVVRTERPGMCRSSANLAICAVCQDANAV